MFQRMFLIEHTKIFRQGIFWIETALLAGIAVLMHALLYLALRIMPAAEQTPEALAEIRNTLTWPGALVNLFSLPSGAALGSMMIIILVGAVTSQEYQWRTLHLWLGHGVSRASYAAARFLALFLPALAMILVTIAAGGLSSALFTLLLDGRLPFEQISAGQVVLSLLRSAYSLLPYGALAFLLAIATRSAVAAIGAGLAFSFLIENILGQLLGLMGGPLADLARYLPLRLASSLVALNQAIALPPAPAPAGAVDPGVAAAGLALYSLLFFGLAAYLLRKQDLTG